MPEGEQQIVESGQGNAGKWILVLLAIIYVAATVYGFVSLRGRIDQLSKDIQANKAQDVELTRRMQSAEAEAETLGQQVGITKKELTQRAAELQSQQRAAEARLAAEQKHQISQMSGEVAGVRSDVGGVKT